MFSKRKRIKELERALGEIAIHLWEYNDGEYRITLESFIAEYDLNLYYYENFYKRQELEWKLIGSDVLSYRPDPLKNELYKVKRIHKK